MTNPSAVDLEGVIAFHKEQAATHEVSITAWLNRPEQVGEDHPAVQTHRAAVEWHTLAASELSRLQAENEGLRKALNYVADNTYCGFDGEWRFKFDYDPQTVLDALAPNGEVGA